LIKNEADRESIIEQLALVTKYGKQYYQQMSNEELEKEMAVMYGE